MTNAMIPYDKGEKPGADRPTAAGKASVAGIGQVELDGREFVLYTTRNSGDQVLLSVMWSLLLVISLVLLALGMFALDWSIRLILAAGFALCSLVICGQLYRYYKWDRDRYIVLTDKNIYTNVLYHGAIKLPPAVISVDKIGKMDARFRLGRGHSVIFSLKGKEDAVDCELRFPRAEEFHNFVDIFEDARNGRKAR
ncbi:MAG: hypothetical protein HFE39_05580 [Clostridiales bacterium]|jgi:hypothetical protein|nr:hypothetical protein [Clostridiales bacterium]